MNTSTLKSVVVLDLETHRYKPAAHNLSPEEAADVALDFTARNTIARVLDQEERHRVPDATKCKACKRAAENETEKRGEKRHG